MDFLTYQFPVSGVETSILLPPMVAFVISFFASMGGVSGAFLILPFQMSFLHFVSPAVTATNFVYNIVAIPSGVYLYIKEGRMLWPLAWTMIIGTLPGILIGYYFRIYLLPDPRGFKFFVGCVLLYISGRLIYQVLGGRRGGKNAKDPSVEESDIPGSLVANVSLSWKKTAFEFRGGKYHYNTIVMLSLSFVVGIIGGTYGVGGGSIVAPFCVAVFHLPVYTIAGASLMGTFITSISGVAFYSILPGPEGLSKSPDWLLGFLFGMGGFAGIYFGARAQKFVPERFIKGMLGAASLFVAWRYISQFLFQ